MYQQIRIGFLAVAVLMIAACTNPETGVDRNAARSPELDAVAEAAVAEGFPGAVIASSDVDGRIHTGAAGLADRADSVAMHPDARIHAASTTKAITAAATLILVDRDSLSLDQTLPELLPSKVSSLVPHHAKITLRNLLLHTSGIYSPNNNRRYLARYIGPERRKKLFWTPEDIVAFAADPENPPISEPGSDPAYSDINYVLLSLIVEEASGREFKDFVEEEIFAPCGMRDSYFLSDAPEAPRARGYTLESEIIRTVGLDSALTADADSLIDTTGAQEQSDGAAGIITTVPDLVRFGDAFLRGDLITETSRDFVLSVTERMGEDGKALGVLRAYRKPYGTIVAAEGDGPGINVVWAMNMETRQIVAAAVNLFGRWDENEYLVDVMIEGELAE